MPKNTVESPKLPASVVEHYKIAQQLQPDLLPEEHLDAFEIYIHREAFASELKAAVGLSQQGWPGAVMEECYIGVAA